MSQHDTREVIKFDHHTSDFRFLILQRLGQGRDGGFRLRPHPAQDGRRGVSNIRVPALQGCNKDFDIILALPENFARDGAEKCQPHAGDETVLHGNTSLAW